MIAIRKKKRKNYTRLYLDINLNGLRRWEPLDLVLTGGKSDREVLAVADRIRAKRLIEISEGEYDLAPSGKSNKDFLKFYQKVIDDHPEYERKVSLLKHLKTFIEK